MRVPCVALREYGEPRSFASSVASHVLTSLPLPRPIQFPAYCNFFFYRRRVTLIVASKEIERRIRKVFQETLFGPENVDVTQDFVEGTPKEVRGRCEKMLYSILPFCC